MDRTVAADLVVVLEAFINSAADDHAWYLPAASAAQQELQQALRRDDVVDAHDRAAQKVAA